MNPAGVRVERDCPWVEPLAVAAGLAGRDGLVCLLSDGTAQNRRSVVAVEPDRVTVETLEPGRTFAALRGVAFQRNTIGLVSYDAGARIATGTRPGTWPDLILARYPAMLVFDHVERSARVVAFADTQAEAEAACARGREWLDLAAAPFSPGAPASEFEAEADPEAYEAAVADVVERIAAGELFQANIARGWRGALKPGAGPFDVFARLSGGAPFGAFWAIGGRAVVSNSPELFLTFDRATRRIETRPIKGTRGRDPDPARDAALVADLVASAKDRAENLMIVDLMRNDLARVCVPGSVVVERLFEVESHPTVHHLVSTVSGTARETVVAADVLEAAFPPGSITGAPKHQAMKVIAHHEPPRGPWCGSLFLLDDRGDLTASVLIRTAAFERDGAAWSWRTLAGAGIVADSVPSSELAETDIKIAALRRALIGDD